MAAILMGMICTVLFAVSQFNRSIPGLRAWTLSYLLGFGVSVVFLLRSRMPEVVSVVFTQLFLFLAAYCSVVGCRAYVGLPRLRLHIPLVLGSAMTALSVYFTLVVPHMGMRVLWGSSLAGVLYLMSAHAITRGTARRYPARYLVGTAYALHALFLFARPWLFQLGGIGGDAPQPSETISQFILLETILALILLAFGTLMLINEFITRELRHLAEKDFLTGVFNRRAFLGLLDKAASLAQRTNVALPILLLDLDRFKDVNDTHGHKVGDQLLRHFVAVAEPCLRKEDVLGRLGGEEFAVFLPNTGAEDARHVSERLRAMVAAQPLLTDRGPVSLTVSIGIALCLPGEAPEQALHRADQAMYQAKEHGRNRVVSLATAQA